MKTVRVVAALRAAIICTSILSFSLSSIAQVDVVESRPVASGSSASLNNSGAPSGSPTVSASNSQAELFYQLQTLQQEVLQLRGLVEELTFEVKRLKQQRMDDYLDLDRRLSRLSGGALPKVGDPAAESSNISNTSPAPAASGQGDGERELYLKAIDLVLKQKDYDQAIVTLNQYLASYSDGRYAPNAYYWLGQIYLVRQDLEPARKHFKQLLDDFPSHAKVPEATFKLAKVYHLMGDVTTARPMLEEVAAGNSGAARLAKTYLEENF